MEKTWVDFAAVKQSVTMTMVLDHYKVNWLRKTDYELRGRCPIHKGEGPDAFHVNEKKNCFQCFSCKARGNVLDFVAAMEQCSVRDAGLKIQEWFATKAAATESPTTSSQLATKKDDAAEDRGEGAAENKPLTFLLRGVDPAHEYLLQRGISQQTAEIFGLGFYTGKGSMSGRVVIPIHNQRGDLVAYAGRAIDDGEPKYKFPAGFHKGLELYNLHRAVPASGSTVVLVEGFFGCIKVHEAGFPCVSLMGCSLSEIQEDLLRDFSGAVIMLDGDEAGQQGTEDCLRRLGRHMWVKAAIVPQGKQPDQLSTEELGLLLT